MRPETKKLKKQCDNLWSEIIKVKAGYRCEKCGKQKTDFVKVVLQSHHVITRAVYSTRYLIENGVCLCKGCHFLAHINTEAFREWCGTRRDYHLLNSRRKMPFKKDYQAIKIYLEQELKRLKSCT